MSVISSNTYDFTQAIAHACSLLTIIPTKPLDWKQLLITVLFCTYSFMLSFLERNWYVAPRQLLISSSRGLKWRGGHKTQNSKQTFSCRPRGLKVCCHMPMRGELQQKPVRFLWFVDGKALKLELFKKNFPINHIYLACQVYLRPFPNHLRDETDWNFAVFIINQPHWVIRVLLSHFVFCFFPCRDYVHAPCSTLIKLGH